MSPVRSALTPAPRPRDPWQLAGDVVCGLFLFYAFASGAAALALALRDWVTS